MLAAYMKKNDIAPTRWLIFRGEKDICDSEPSVCWWLLPFLSSRMEEERGCEEVLLLDI